VTNVWHANQGQWLHQLQFDSPKEKVAWNQTRGGYLATMSSTRLACYNVSYLGGEYCPTWLGASCGARLAFGGKLVSFGTEFVTSSANSHSASTNNLSEAATTPSGGGVGSGAGGKSLKRKVKIPPSIRVDFVPKSTAMIERAQQFKKTLQSLSTPEDVRTFAQNKLTALRNLLVTVKERKQLKPPKMEKQRGNS